MNKNEKQNNIKITMEKTIHKARQRTENVLRLYKLAAAKERDKMHEMHFERDKMHEMQNAMKSESL